jgi:putative FmdB family regulatory protein
MPLYEFVCQDCDREQELLVRQGETPQCEKCGGQRLAKLLSVPAAPAGGESRGASPGPGSCGAGCGCH